jgi:hypothetical protein
VADLFSGDAGYHHDLRLGEIRAPGQNLLTASCQFALRPHRQGEQVEQGVEVGLLAQLFKAEPHHLLIQKHLQRLGGAELEAAMGRDH